MAAPKSDNTHLGTISGWGVNWEHYVAAGTYTVCNRPCAFTRIVINTTAAAGIILRDGSKVIGNMKASMSEGSYTYNIRCNTKLIIELAGASDVTVCFA